MPPSGERAIGRQESVRPARAIGAGDNRSVYPHAERARQIRLTKGLSRSELAQRSKGGPYFLSEATLKRVEAGQPVYASTVSSLAALLGVPVSALLLDGETVLQQPTLAILPLRVDTADDASLAEGLSEDLITRFAHWWFPVIDRTSTFRDHRTAAPPRAEALGADYVIDGTLRRTGDRLQVTAQLLEVTSTRIVARYAYQRALDGVFQAQRTLASAIAADLGPSLLDLQVSRLEKRYPDDLVAWQRALLGAWHFHRRTQADNARARALLERALEADSHMPLAWYTLALTHQHDLVNQWASDPTLALQGLSAACARFERLYPEDAGVRVISAYVDVYAGRRDAAMERLVEAIDRDPNLGSAYSLYGQTLAMAHEPDRALEQYEVALRLSPRDADRWSIHTAIALAHFVAERYEDTLAAAEDASRILPSAAFPYCTLASTHALLGDLPAARNAVNALRRVAPNATLQGLLSIMGSTDRDIADRYLAGLRRAGFPT